MNSKLSVLFLCTGNSCRSQMAEGYTRSLWGGRYEVASAGIFKHGLNPVMVQVMAEDGVDVSRQQSNTMEELENQQPDFVITVCDHANEVCPVFPAGVAVLHRGFDDPPILARLLDDDEQELDCYRRVRDEIRVMVEGLPDLLQQSLGPGEAVTRNPDQR